jgi:hypothetical protein
MVASFAYLDDLMIFSESPDAHEKLLHQIFTKLKNHGLVINLEKCTFGASSVDYLGHRVSAEGVRPLPSYVQAVEEVPQPGTVKQLQAFLRLVNFYRRFLPAIASKLKPLTDTLKGDVQGNDVV